MADVATISATCEDAIGRHPNMLVPWYLMACYAYYECDDPIIDDGLFDRICFLLSEHLDMIDIDHPHAYLCDLDALAAGTGYQLHGKYPAIVRSTAERFRAGEFPA